jgi:hypothetical protein
MHMVHKKDSGVALFNFADLAASRMEDALDYSRQQKPPAKGVSKHRSIKATLQSRDAWGQPEAIIIPCLDICIGQAQVNMYCVISSLSYLQSGTLSTNRELSLSSF